MKSEYIKVNKIIKLNSLGNKSPYNFIEFIIIRESSNVHFYSYHCAFSLNHKKILKLILGYEQVCN